MRMSQTLRRVALVASTAALLTGVPFAGVALAANGAITNVSPTAAANTGNINVSFTTAHTFTSIANTTVKLTRSGTSEQITATSPTGTGTSVTVTAPLARVNPGTYDIQITGTAVPLMSDGASPPPYTDSCSSCFQVLASAPTISSPTTGSPVTVGGGAVKVPLTVNGSNYTNDVYCSSACGDEPTIAISPSTGITLVGSNSDDSDTNATATSIAKKISVAPGAATGPRDIVVTNTDHQSATCTGCLVIAPTPTLTDITPATRAVGAAQTNLVLTGSNFVSPVTVNVFVPGATNEQGDGNITVGTPTVNSSTKITVPVTVLSAATTGPRNVRVTNPDKGSVLATSLFSVTPKPTITGVAYIDNSAVNQYGQGAQSRTLRITGTNFLSNAVVTFADMTGITIDSTTVNSPTQVDVDLTFAQAGSTPPPAATKAITLTNTDGGTVTNAPGLTVSNGPSITSITPPSRGRGATSNIVIAGANFHSSGGGVTVMIPDVTVNSATVDNSGQITANITVSNALNIAGVKSVTVLNNDDKGQYVCAGCFTVDNLQTDSVTPGTGLNDSSKTLTIGGSGFASDATVQLVKTGNGQATITPISGTSVTVNPAGTSITATFALAGVAPGTWSPRVTNPSTNPGVGMCTCTFTVVASAPTITNLSQTSMGAGAENEVLTITGTGFLPGATLTFDNAGITLAGPITVTPTTITAHLNIARSAYTPPPVVPPAPQETLTVANTDNQSDSADFTVNAPPTATSTTPAARARGSAPSTITLTGKDIVDGAAILVSGTGVTVGTATMTAGGTPAAPTQTLTASLTVAPDAALGARTVSVRNPDGGHADCSPVCTLTVTAQPTVSTVSPARGARSTAPAVTITGTGFSSGVTVSAGTGITTNVTSTSPSSLTVTFTIAADAPLTTRDVTVNNTDGGSATKTNAFTVFTKPGAPTGVSGTRGDQKVTVSWTAPSDDGNDTITGYTVTASPGGATATTDGTQTSTDVTGLTNGTAYTFTVHATNAAGNSAESTSSAPVTPATTPGAPTGVTATAGSTTADVSWSAPSSNGGNAITGYTVTSTPEGITASVNGSTLTAHVTGLTNGTAYTFTVHATNDVGDGAESAASNSVTPATVPGAPTSVSATGGDQSAHVTWAAPSDNGGSPITGYLVTSTPGGITKSAAADATSADVTGLTNGTSYTFTVHATNAKGDSPESTASNAVTPATNPGVPTGVTATAGDHSAHVTWSAPSDNGGGAVTGYTVTSTPGGITKSVDGSTLATDVTGLTNGTSYTFTVHATNGAGDSAESAASNAVTPAGVPTAPTAVTATAGHSAATVSWTASSSANGSAITGYTVRSIPAGVSVTVAPAVTSTTLSGLTNGTSYTFTVTATNAKGDSGASAPSNAVVPTWVTSLSESATSKITAGGVTTVSGKLLRSDASGVSGATVRIYAKVAPATTFSLVRSLTTSSTGAYSVTFNLSRNTRFKAVYLGGTGLDPSTSAERLTSVAYRIGASYSLSGRTLTVTGSTYPSGAGRLIYLRRRNSNGTYTQLSYTRIASNGTYRMSRSLAPGTYTLYVFLSNGTNNVAGQSAFRTITVR
jgi:hypothetical protein